MNAVQKEPLEERLNSVLNKAIRWDEGEWKVKWNIISMLCASNDSLCERAYKILTNNLIKRNILSESKEGNYDLFIMYDIPFGELFRNAKGKDLYFTRLEYADAYKRLVRPSQSRDLRVAHAQ